MKNNGQRTGRAVQASKPTATQKAARALLKLMGGDSANNGTTAQRTAQPISAQRHQGAQQNVARAPQQRAPQGQRRELTPEQRRQLAARRMQQKKAIERRKKLTRVGVALGALLLLLILSLTVFFKIDKIEVSSEQDVAYSAEQISAASGIAPGTVNLFRCDLEQVARRIEKELPYIGSATVKRSFPSSLKISVVPTSAAAAIDMSTGYLLIDKNAKMLEYIGSTPSVISVLRCQTDFDVKLGEIITLRENETREHSSAGDTVPSTEPDFVTLFKDIVTAIEQSQIKSITLIDIRDEKAIKLTYQNRLVLYLGTDTRLKDKLDLAVLTLGVEDDSSSTKMGFINLTTVGKADVNEGVAIEEETTAQESPQ